MAGKREQSGVWVSLGIGATEDFYFIELYDTTTAIPHTTDTMSLVFSSTVLMASFSAAAPSISFSSALPAISFSSTRPEITFSAPD